MSQSSRKPREFKTTNLLFWHKRVQVISVETFKKKKSSLNYLWSYLFSYRVRVRSGVSPIRYLHKCLVTNEPEYIEYRSVSNGVNGVERTGGLGQSE